MGISETELIKPYRASELELMRQYTSTLGSVRVFRADIFASVEYKSNNQQSHSSFYPN
ncbi:hypothetical protein DL89DRAFT_265837, partial [Linderina pennispora]